MYNRFYGFRENPFNQTPDSDFFFASDKHRSALDALLYAIQQSKGFVVVTGDIGSGKTTVMRKLLRELGDTVQSAVITNTHISPKGILTLVMEDLGIPYRPGPKERVLVQLNEHLIQQAMEDRNVVLLVDEAQNLTPSCLEEIRMLSNLETEKEKLIQIVLIGQPELRKKLEMRCLEQLRQRIAIHVHLTPLDEEETKQYILHRLKRAVTNFSYVESLFHREALSCIYHYSRGVPRIINHLCDRALLTACLSETKQITPFVIEEAITELRFKGEKII